MRGHLSPAFALVLLYDVPRVDGQTTVGVDDDAEESRVSLGKIIINNIIIIVVVIDIVIIINRK